MKEMQGAWMTSDNTKLEKFLNVFTGNISPIALLVSSFYWSWFDIVPFSPALFLAAGVPTDAFPLTFSLIVSVIVLLVLAICSRLRVAVMRPGAFAISSLVGGATGSLLVFVGAQTNSLPIMIVGALLVGIYQGVGIVVVGGLITCEGMTHALIHIASALTLNTIPILLVVFLQPLPSAVFSFLLPIASAGCYMVFFGRREHRALMQSLIEKAQKMEKTAALRRGRRFTKHNYHFLVILFVVCCSFGFINHRAIFGEAVVGSYYSYISLAIRAVVSLVVIVGYLYYCRRPYSILRIALTLMTLGLLASASLLLDYTDALLPESLFLSGYACFDLVIWAIIMILSKEACMSVLKTICIVDAIDQLGIFVGALLGGWYGEGNVSIAVSVVLGALLFVLVLGFVEKKSTVKDDLSELDIEPAFVGESAAIGPLVQDGLSQSGLSVSNEIINDIAVRHFLTKREHEIFILLVAGRSVPYISDLFCLSDNTVKSHVRHIYAKLDVHNRQELIDLVSPH